MDFRNDSAVSRIAMSITTPHARLRNNITDYMFKPIKLLKSTSIDINTKLPNH